MSDQNQAAAPTEAAPTASEVKTETEGKAIEKQAEQAAQQAEQKAVEQAAQQAKTWKLKAKDGSLIELKSEEELVRRAQLGVGAEAAMHEAAKIRKEREAFDNLLKSDKRQALAQLGIDPEKYAEEVMAEKWRKDSLAPEQRELEELKAKYSQAEEKARLLEDQQKQAVINQYIEQQTEAYRNVITEGIKAAGDLPVDGYTIGRAAHYIQQAVENNVQLTMDQVVALVRDDYDNSYRAKIGALDGDGLLDFLGDDVLKKVRDADVKRVESKRIANLQKPGRKAVVDDDLPEYPTFKDFDKWQERKLARMEKASNAVMKK